MNQPKFKFGDTLTTKNGDNFVIGSICLQSHGWTYGVGGPAYAVFNESELELYKEPVAKKLHAHTVKVHTINGGYFFEYKFIHPGTPTPSGWMRASDYDIDYPLNHSSKE